jgi:D-alanine-D-alanine ligase
MSEVSTAGERIRLVVLFGGQSAEHDVSCTTAFHVMRAADPARYELVPVGIGRDGTWHLAEGARAALAAGGASLPGRVDAEGEVVSPAQALVPGDAPARDRAGGPLTVVLPLLHGPMGEDGTVQGLLELVGVPYVGTGVLGSALGMDKAMAKDVLARHGLPQARWVGLRETDVSPGRLAAVVDALGLPVFVKPANMGSSVGVSKVRSAEDLPAAVDAALVYDEWVVIEEAIVGREIEVAVLGNLEPRASVPGEIVPGNEFYDYADKYLEDGAQLLVPAPLSPPEVAEVQRLAIEVFEVLRCDGLARVDFFYEEGGRGFLCNEVNTMPGFTPISMYPKLWQASGLTYPELIDELVRLALERHARKRRTTTR